MATRYEPCLYKKETHVEVEMEEDENGEYVHEDDFMKAMTALISVRDELPPGSVLRKWLSHVIADL